MPTPWRTNSRRSMSDLFLVMEAILIFVEAVPGLAMASFLVGAVIRIRLTVCKDARPSVPTAASGVDDPQARRGILRWISRSCRAYERSVGLGERAGLPFCTEHGMPTGARLPDGPKVARRLD